MKILVLGSSNSVRNNAWTTGIKESIPTIEITNLSAGGSPGVQFTTQIKMDFTKYEFVIFDSLPNDEEYYFTRDGYSELEYTNSILQELLSTISNQSKLIILNIPMRKEVLYSNTQKDKPSEIAQTRKKIANISGAQIIDVGLILKFFSSFTKGNYQNLYENYVHPLPYILKMIGRILGEVLSKPENNNHFKKSNHNFEENYLIVPLSTVIKTEEIALKTTLIDDTFYLAKEHTINLESYSDYRCIGFYANFSDSKAFLNIKTTSEPLTIKLADVTFIAKTLKAFVPIPNGYCISEITCSNEPIGKIYRPLMIDHKDTPIENPRLVMRDFIFRKNIPFNNDLPLNPQFDENYLSNEVSISLVSYLSELSKTTPPQHGHLINSINNTSLFYDQEKNHCTFLDQRLVSIFSIKLIPVKLAFNNDGLAYFYINHNSTNMTLTAYSNGISLEHHFLLNCIPTDNNRLGKKLGQHYNLTRSGEQFSLSIDGKFLRVVLDITGHNIRHDRLRPGPWEMLTYSDICETQDRLANYH